MDRVRMDKWLWAARFFKTRVLAGQACDMGRIECNGISAKPAREVKPGDRLWIKTDGSEYEIEVLKAEDNRGSAAVAATMYSETAESQAKRAKVAAERKALQDLVGWQETA